MSITLLLAATALVPFVLVLGHGYPAAADAFWYQLALTSTLAGNLPRWPSKRGD